MDYRTLDLTVISAKDLNKVNLITKMDVYVVVSISGGDKKSKQKTKTPVDNDGDTNPNWNFPMKFTVNEADVQQKHLTLVFKLVCERALGDKDIGEVEVSIKDLLESPASGADGKQPKFASYQVRKPSGKPKGELTFSYKFSDKIVGEYAPPPPAAMKVDDKPVTAFPANPMMAGPSSGYPPPPPHGGYPPYPVAEGTPHYPPPAAAAGAPPPHGGYPPPPPPAYAYPAQPPYGGYPPPPQPGYGYPPQPGYGYPPQPGYGYPPAVQQQPPKKNKFGMGLGAGLLGGAIGGLLIGDMISDSADYDCGGFDF